MIRWCVELFVGLALMSLLAFAGVMALSRPTATRALFDSGVATGERLVPYVATALVLAVAFAVLRRVLAWLLRRRYYAAARRTAAHIRPRFTLRACHRCYGAGALLLDVEERGRSIQTRCRQCSGSRQWAAGASEEDRQLVALWARLARLQRWYRRLSPRPRRLGEPWLWSEPATLPHRAARRENIPAAVRRHVLERDGARCRRCGASDNLHLDHIIPVARGGATTVKNLEVLCQRCNLTKAASLAPPARGRPGRRGRGGSR